MKSKHVDATENHVIWPSVFANKIEWVNCEKILRHEDSEVWGRVQPVQNLPLASTGRPAASGGAMVLVEISQHLHTSFSQRFDFSSFPFDRQRLSLWLQMADAGWQFSPSTGLIRKFSPAPPTRARTPISPSLLAFFCLWTTTKCSLLRVPISPHRQHLAHPLGVERVQ
jgi:hypothetical protein